MKLSKLLKNINAKSSYEDREITSLTDNSRRVTKGCVFVCIKGRSFDGHSFAKEAESKGAAAVVTERDMGIKSQIIVSDTRKAYPIMCAEFFDNPANKLKLIGITGTNGKTTTAFLLKNVFDELDIMSGLIGTVKNMIGPKELHSDYTTPEPYALQELFSQMVKEKCEYCIMEVSSQALSQGRVSNCHFDTAIFTNLTQDHLDYHGTFEEYTKAKKLLFSMCDTAIINLDDEAALGMVEDSKARIVTFSVKTDISDYTAKNINCREDAIEYEMVTTGRIGRVHLSIPGEFSIYNSMAAAVAAVELGFEFKSVINSLQKAKIVKGRAEIVSTNTDYTVIIDYAHTPDALKNILKALRRTTKNRIITVFGCGGDRDKEKRPKMGKIASIFSDLVVVTSDNPRSEEPKEIIAEILEGMKDATTPYVTVEDRTKAIEYALNEANAGDIVLLAGKGHETYQILKMDIIHYDEREIVNKILEYKENIT